MINDLILIQEALQVYLFREISVSMSGHGKSRGAENPDRFSGSHITTPASDLQRLTVCSTNWGPCRYVDFKPPYMFLGFWDISGQTGNKMSLFSEDGPHFGRWSPLDMSPEMS